MAVEFRKHAADSVVGILVVPRVAASPAAELAAADVDLASHTVLSQQWQRGGLWRDPATCAQPRLMRACPRRAALPTLPMAATGVQLHYEGRSRTIVCGAQSGGGGPIASPLAQVRWLRLVWTRTTSCPTTGEACAPSSPRGAVQPRLTSRVGAHGSARTTVARGLSAERRWVCTGTPMSGAMVADDLSRLHGLCDYLGREPYARRSWWQQHIAGALCAGAGGEGDVQDRAGDASYQWARRRLCRLVDDVTVRTPSAVIGPTPAAGADRA